MRSSTPCRSDLARNPALHCATAFRGRPPRAARMIAIKSSLAGDRTARKHIIAIQTRLNSAVASPMPALWFVAPFALNVFFTRASFSPFYLHLRADLSDIACGTRRMEQSWSVRREVWFSRCWVYAEANSSFFIFVRPCLIVHMANVLERRIALEWIFARWNCENGEKARGKESFFLRLKYSLVYRGN